MDIQLAWKFQVLHLQGKYVCKLKRKFMHCITLNNKTDACIVCGDKVKVISNYNKEKIKRACGTI